MPEEAPTPVLLGRTGDERLLGRDAELVPHTLGRFTPPLDPQGRSVLVTTGVALTGITLLAGIALVVLGIVELLSGTAVAGVAELWAGILLTATHWGWVHVATWRHDKLAERRHGGLSTDRQGWLASIEPYARHEIETTVTDDGSITIETLLYQPVATDPGHFTFTRDRQALEVHRSDTPAAEIAERAELLRRQAAALTAEERGRYEAAAEAQQAAELEARDRQEQLEVRRATSEALSDRLNSRLRDPPLTE